jgi:hypothetical protein
MVMSKKSSTIKRKSSTKKSSPRKSSSVRMSSSVRKSTKKGLSKRAKIAIGASAGTLGLVGLIQAYRNREAIKNKYNSMRAPSAASRLQAYVKSPAFTGKAPEPTVREKLAMYWPFGKKK